MNYTFAPSAPAPLLRRHLHLGGSNPKGEQITVTSRYLERNARPWLPVMGEYHFVRDNRENWYREIWSPLTCSGSTMRRRKESWIFPATATSAPLCWTQSAPGWRSFCGWARGHTANAATAASLIGCCKSLFRCGSPTLNIWHWYAIGTAASTARSRGFSSRTADRSWPCSWKMN